MDEPRKSDAPIAANDRGAFASPAGPGSANSTAAVIQLHAPRASDHQRHRSFTGDPVGLVASLLPNARVVGNGWRADCPLGHTSKGTVALAGASDGRALLKCHAGCGAAEVLGAIGLALCDLYPQRLEPLTPQARRELSEAGRLARKAAALAAVTRELAVIEVAAGRIVADPEAGLSWADYERVCEAHQKIAAARLEIGR